MVDAFNSDCVDSLKEDSPANTDMGLGVVTAMAEITDRADSLAPTKEDPEVNDLCKQLGRADVEADTIATPTKLTLIFSKDVTANFTDYFPKSVRKFLVNESFILGRGDDASVVLNSDTMSKQYGEICQVGNDASSFVLKNISSKKFIEVLYSKGKKRMCHKLKYGEDMEIRTNYILRFHNLEFKVVIEPGDVSADYYELEVTKETPKETPPADLPAQTQPLVVNNGQINKLYMANRPVDMKAGPVNMSVSSAGSNVVSVGPNVAVQRGAAPERFPHGGQFGYQGQPAYANMYPGQRGYPVTNAGYQMGNGQPMPNPGYPMNVGYPPGPGGQYMNGGYQMGNPAPPTNMYGHPMTPGYAMPMGNYGQPVNPFSGNPQNFNTGYPNFNAMNGMGFGMPAQHPVKVNSEDLSSFCPTPQERRSEDQFLYPYQQESGGNWGDSLKPSSGRSNLPQQPVENSEMPDPIARLMQKADA